MPISLSANTNFAMTRFALAYNYSFTALFIACPLYICFFPEMLFQPDLIIIKQTYSGA